MFYVRTVLPEQNRVETSALELSPTNEDGEKICDLFREFFRNRPTHFRDKLEFVTRGNFELDWSAAPGGVALASLLRAGEPVLMAVLISGIHPEADDTMTEAFRDSVLEPLFGKVFHEGVVTAERPLLLQVALMNDPEWAPVLRLLSAALASVYFRACLQVKQQEAVLE